MGMDPRTDPHPRAGPSGEAERRTGGKPKPPTVRQVYALAAALCEKHGEQFPETRADASQLIERLRHETGHPSPRLEDASSAQGPRPGRRR
jgi:hypothetical protein